MMIYYQAKNFITETTFIDIKNIKAITECLETRLEIRMCLQDCCLKHTRVKREVD